MSCVNKHSALTNEGQNLNYSKGLRRMLLSGAAATWYARAGLGGSLSGSTQGRQRSLTFIYALRSREGEWVSLMFKTDLLRARTHRLHEVTVDPARNVIQCGGRTIQLEPKVMDVLCALLEQPGAVLSREMLASRVWGMEFVSDESLTRAVSLLRRAFREADGEREYIETLSKRGYRLVVDERAVEAGPPAAAVSAAPAETRPSIAVLAFADMSPAGDQEHFSDGVSEEIINALSSLHSLRVIGRTSSFAFRKRSETIPAIAAALNVTHVLQGSVRKHGQRLRISAQLIEAAGERHIWSQTFDGDYADVFDLQENIATATAASLKALFETGDAPRLASKLTSSQEAYDLFLRGRSLGARIHGEGVLQQAVACLERAISLDPAFAEAWAELGNVFAQIAIYSVIDDRGAMVERAYAAAARAIALRPDYGYPRTVQAFCRVAANDFVDGLRLSTEGVRLDPDNPDALWRHGYCLTTIGRIKDAMPFLKAAVDRDPLQGRNLGILAQAYLCMGDYETAEIHARRALDLGYLGAVHMYATSAHARGLHDVAIDRLMTESVKFGSMFWPEYTTPELWRFAAQGFYSGKAEDRIPIVNGMKMVARTSARKDELSIIGCFALTGAAEEFFEAWGPQPYPGSSLMLLSLWTNIEPACQIRADPGFPAFAERIGLTAAWREYGRPDVLEANTPA
jgi:TolB-like protein